MTVLDRVPARALTVPFAATMAPDAARFARALRDPKRAQTAALLRIAREVPALAHIRSLDDLRALPLTAYDDVAADIERVAREGNVARLTRAPVLRFERSGGSSGAQKLLPQTAPFLAEMNRALSPWLFSLYSRRDVGAGSAYWSISPIGDKRGTTAGGIDVGSVDDASYFPPLLRSLVSRVLAVPADVAGFHDVDACRYATLRVLLERDDLTLISVWSPTFLTLLFDVLDRHLDRLLDDLARGTCTIPATPHDDESVAGAARERALAAALPLRAMPDRTARLRARAKNGALDAHDIWPSLALLSMWTDASSARFVDAARARCPGVAVQPKGLLAVEGVVSIPYAGAHPLAVRSHVLEFIDDDGRAHFAHEIERGRTYEVALTTSAGLVRYRLGDRVVVDGAIHATPSVRFVGRAHVSDLVGEKLSASFVGHVLDELCPGARFAMLAPTRAQPPHYRLYLEGAMPGDALARAVDDALAAGHPYRYARALGQLGPVDVVVVADAARAYEAACVQNGQRAGDVKPTSLHTRDDWDARFRPA